MNMNVYAKLKWIFICWCLFSLVVCGFLFYEDKISSMAWICILNGLPAFCILSFCFGFIEKRMGSNGNKINVKKTWLFKNTPMISLSFIYFLYKQKINYPDLIPSEVRSLYFLAYSVYVLTIVFVFVALRFV